MDAELTPALAADTLKPAVDLVLGLRAQAELLREEIDAMDRRILAEQNYPVDPEWSDWFDGTHITQPDQIDFMHDGDAEAFFALREQAIRNAGHTVPEGHCPALMAESAVRAAEKALIQLGATLPGLEVLTWERLSRGLEGKLACDLIREHVTRLVQLVTLSDGYVHPLA